MGLFDKKYCDICGEKIGFLGNRKLEDGNLCKNCAAKLSPFFDERRHSTVDQIKEQLNYREANQEAVAAFHTTRALGRDTKVLLDEDAQLFMVTSARNLTQANPDVIQYSQVTGCDMDISEDRDELMQEVKDSEGKLKRVSYYPSRYEYSYDFHMIIQVNHPYFDQIKFKLNSSSIKIQSMNAANRPMADRSQGFHAAQQTDPRMQNPDYAEYYNMGLEIKETLTSIRTQVRETIAADLTPKASLKCPYCGAVVVPDADHKCEFCGSVIGTLN